MLKYLMGVCIKESNIARHGRLLLCTFCLTGTDTCWQIMTDNKWTRQNVWTRGLTRSELRVQDWQGAGVGFFLSGRAARNNPRFPPPQGATPI